MAEYAYNRIGRDIREGRVRNLVMLYGKESYLIDWALGLLIGEYINPAVKALDYTHIEAGDVVCADIETACEMLPVMSEKKVVSVRFGEEKSKVKEAELIDYIGNLPESSLLILCFYKEKISAGLEKAAKNAIIYEFAPFNKTKDEKTLLSFIAKEARTWNKTISPSVARELVIASGYLQKDSEYTLYNLKNDMIKLCAHAAGDQIESEDVEAVTSGNIEKDVFKMVDCICRNRKDEALKLLHNLLTSGTSPFHVTSLIISQFETILSVKELKDMGYNLTQIKNALKIHEFRVKIAMGLSGRYSQNSLKKILVAAYSIENDIKTGNLDSKMALELFIAGI